MDALVLSQNMYTAKPIYFQNEMIKYFSLYESPTPQVRRLNMFAQKVFDMWKVLTQPLKPTRLRLANYVIAVTLMRGLYKNFF